MKRLFDLAVALVAAMFLALPSFFSAALLKELMSKIGISICQALFQPHACPPTPGVQSADIHQFPRRPIRFGRIEDDLTSVTDHVPDGFGQFLDRHIRPSTDIHQWGLELARLGFVTS